MSTTNQQALEMMQKLMQKKPKLMPVRGERTAKNAQKKPKK
jgi:hypothetical protein